jgi:hypothetical protein
LFEQTLLRTRSPSKALFLEQSQEELENLLTLYKIDFVDFNKVDDNFKN